MTAYIVTLVNASRTARETISVSADSVERAMLAGEIKAYLLGYRGWEAKTATRMY